MLTILEKKAEEFINTLKDNENVIRQTKAVSSIVNLKPGECKTLCNKVDLKFHDGLEKRVLNYRLTDTTVDHDNEVIIPKGVDLKDFKGNPVILGFHNGRKFPVGKAIKTFFNKETNSIDAWVLFYDKEIDDTGVSDSFFKIASTGGMTKGSIGFTAKYGDVRRPSPEERDTFGIDKNGWIWDKITLLEYSLTSVPSNKNSGQIPSFKDVFGNKTLEYIEKNESIQRYKSIEGIELNTKSLCKIYIRDDEDKESKLEQAKEFKKDYNVELIIGQPESINEKISSDIITKTKKILSYIEELKAPLEKILKADSEEGKSTKTTTVQNDSEVEESVDIYGFGDALDKAKEKMLNLN